MHRIDGPGATVDNRFTEGNPALGILATAVTDDWANAEQEEICSVIEGAGISLVKADNTQLLQAILSFINQYNPVGNISMWAGSIASIPAKFRLCNGANGTPNLQDRFIVGAGSAYTVGSVGGSIVSTTGAGGAHTPTMQTAGSHAHSTNSAGSHAHTTTVDGAHSHTLTIDATTLSIAQIPSHSHPTGSSGAGAPSGADLSGVGYGAASNTGAIGGGGSHTHGGSANSAGGHSHTTDTQGLHSHATDTQGLHAHVVDAVATHTHSVSSTPPFFALAFIMRFGT